MMVATGIVMSAIGIIAAAVLAYAARGGDSFAVGGAQLGRIVMRLRCQPGRIELRRMCGQRRSAPIGCRSLSARLRGISHRQIVVRAMNNA